MRKSVNAEVFFPEKQSMRVKVSSDFIPPPFFFNCVYIQFFFFPTTQKVKGEEAFYSIPGYNELWFLRAKKTALTIDKVDLKYFSLTSLIIYEMVLDSRFSSCWLISKSDFCVELNFTEI